MHSLDRPKPVITFVFNVLRNGVPRCIVYRQAQTCQNAFFQCATECAASVHSLLDMAQTCDNVCVQCAMEWSASVHSLDRPKPVITFVFNVLRNGLLRCIV